MSRKTQAQLIWAGWLLAIVVVLLLVRCEARADEPTRVANQALALQLADAATTRALLRCPGTFERDPIARPFTHSDATALLSAVTVNLVLRRAAPHTFRSLRWGEALLVANNVRVIERACR